MRHSPFVVGLLILVFSLAASAARASVLPGEVFVRFRAEAPAPDRLRAHGAPDAGVLAARPTFTDAPAAAPSARPTAAVSIRAGLRRTLTLELAPGVDAEAVAREWAARPDVEFAAPIRLLPLLARYTPNDPLLSEQWHHEAVGSREAWAVTPGDSSVVIAIVDTGIDLEHPDLAPNLWVNRAEAEGLPGVDDDGNGWIDDRNGYDFTDVPEVLGAGDFRDRDPHPDDDIGHGTWVAGMAAAAGDNGVDGAGVAYGCRIMALRAGFLPRSGFALGFLAEDDAAAAILYAADNGADVINLSFGDVLRAPILE
ncbi:MAG TPA: S8 family serine peptidase, partial [Arenibaculum sp.]|nr:S8 family serine peptidase [Arenibaculum sp.]